MGDDGGRWGTMADCLLTVFDLEVLSPLFVVGGETLNPATGAYVIQKIVHANLLGLPPNQGSRKVSDKIHDVRVLAKHLPGEPFSDADILVCRKRIKIMEINL